MKAFLSYPSEHEIEAREVKQFIRSVGLDCWFDKESLAAGEDWERTRRIAQSGADVIVLLCASQTTDRNGVYQREIAQALGDLRDHRLGSVYLIPLRLEDVALPPELSRLQYIDKFDSNWKHALAVSLLKAARDTEDGAPLPLHVAGAVPDEGGIVPQAFNETRPEGEFQLS